MRFALVAMIGGCDDRSTPTASSSTAPQKHVDSEKVEAALAAANEYVQTGEIEKAEAILRTLIARSPDESRGHEMLGQTLMQKAMNAERANDQSPALEFKRQAYASYREAVRCDPSTPGLQHSAGLMAMAAGESDAALAHFQAAERFDPGNPQYALFAAQLLIPLKRLDEAEAALQRVLAINADEPYAHASLAMIALEREQFDRALQEMTAARRALPDDVGLRAQHAKVYRRMNQPRQALELLIGLDAADRAQEVVAFEIAAAYDMLGESAKAARAWELCVEANPLAPRPRIAFAALQAAKMHLKAGDAAAAMRCTQTAEQATPHSEEVARMMTEVRAALPH